MPKKCRLGFSVVEKHGRDSFVNWRRATETGVQTKLLVRYRVRMWVDNEIDFKKNITVI